MHHRRGAQLKTVAEITDYIKQNGIKYIFHEELADPKVARSIADAAGCELLNSAPDTICPRPTLTPAYPLPTL